MATPDISSTGIDNDKTTSSETYRNEQNTNTEFTEDNIEDVGNHYSMYHLRLRYLLRIISKT